MQNIKNRIAKSILEQELPPGFIETVERWYAPIAKALAERQNAQSRCILVGIQGCQGSGKSTLASFLKIILENKYELTTAVLSIDDFYLTKAERETLAQTTHPMLATRGAPGTHDIPLAEETIHNLQSLCSKNTIRLPRFNKAIDDRAPSDTWPTIEGPIDIIILEGWCVGLGPQDEASVHQPVNSLEQEFDTQGLWRRYVNDQLKGPYQKLYAQLDTLVVLRAPSFECVYDWRLLQEQKLIDQTLQKNPNAALDQTMTPDQIRKFVAHYQRLTEHGIQTLPEQADYILTLTRNHQISGLQIQANEN